MSIHKGKRVRINSPDEGVLDGIVTDGNNTRGYTVKLEDGDCVFVSHHYLTVLEDVDKPKLRKISDVLWTCSNTEVLAYGSTLQGAYEIWKAIVSNRHNAVAY